MHNPDISVIMGTYNPSIREIRRAIDSIRNQSFEDWEFLIYDDGSEPSVSDGIFDLVKADERIKYIKGEKNKGLAHALNQCIDISRGHYIARMDDDDISDPDRLILQKTFLDDNKKYGWVGSQALLFDDSGVWGRTKRPEKPQKIDFLHSSPFIHPSVMFRREALLYVNGYSEDMRAKRCEDYVLFMKLYAHGYFGYNIQSPLLQYKESRSTLSRSWKYSINESAVRVSAFRELGILNHRTYIYVAKPVLVRIASFFPRTAQAIRLRSTGKDICDKEASFKKNSI